MFDKASLKLGLDKAVLQSMSGRENATNGVKQPSPNPSLHTGPPCLTNTQHQWFKAHIVLFFFAVNSFFLLVYEHIISKLS